MSCTIEYRVTAIAENIRATSMSLRAFWGNIDTISEFAALLELAVAEGMNNVLEHAYSGQAAGEMRIVVQLEKLHMTISIFDRGAAPDAEWVQRAPVLPDSNRKNQETEELSCAGRGRYIMDSLMDSLDYSRVGNENCLKMTKSF